MTRVLAPAFDDVVTNLDRITKTGRRALAAEMSALRDLLLIRYEAADQLRS